MDLATLQTYKQQILNIAESCHVDNVRVFGSVVSGHANASSDVDLLVHPLPGAGFSIGGLNWKLEELLGCKVDIVLDTSIHWYIRDNILNEAIPL